MSEWIAPGPINWERFRPIDRTFPRLASLVANADPGKAHRIGLLGIPFDGAIPSRPGARFGPEAIRQGLLRLAADDGGRSLTMLDVGDYGDVVCLPGSVVATHERCYEAARAVVSATGLPIFLGGDHSLTYPCFRAVAERRKPLGLITFDAHHDVRVYTSEQISSGTPFRRCLELGEDYLRGHNLVQIGLRPFANSRVYADYCAERGVICWSMGEVDSQGIAQLARRAAKLAGSGTGGVYLSIDIDVVDVAFAPGASASAPGGLTSREMLAAVATVAEHANIVAADIMEVSPPLDQGNRTSDLAAMILATILAAHQRRGA